MFLPAFLLFKTTLLVIVIVKPVKMMSGSSYFTGDTSLGEYLSQEYCSESLTQKSNKTEDSVKKNRAMIVVVYNLALYNDSSQVKNPSKLKQSKVLRFLQTLKCSSKKVSFAFFASISPWQFRWTLRNSPELRYQKLTIIFEFDYEVKEIQRFQELQNQENGTSFVNVALQALDYLYERCGKACAGRPFVALFSKTNLHVEPEVLREALNSTNLRPDFRLLVAPERILHARVSPVIHLNPVLFGCQTTRGVYLANETADFEPMKIQPEGCNLQGGQLTASYNQILPFCNIVTEKNGSIVVKFAIETEILKVLEKRFNFTTHLINAKGWGRRNKQGRGWSGIIGQVHNGTSDLGLCYISRTLDRLRAVSVSSPIFVDELTFMSQSPSLASRDWLVFSPFSLDVWMCNLGSGILLTGFVYGILYFHHHHHQTQLPSPISISLQLYAIYLGQSDSLRWNTIPAVRLLYGAWVLAVLILANSYGGCFYSILAVPEFEAPVDTLSDLETIANSDSGRLVTFADSSYLEMFVNSTSADGVFYTVGMHMNRTNPKHIKSDEEAVKAVQEEGFGERKIKTTLIATRLWLATVRRVYGSRPLHIGREIISMDYIGYIFARGSPLTGPFSDIIKRMYQTGLIEKLLSGTFNRLPWKPGASLHSNPTAAVGAVTQPLAIADLRSIFILWSTGLAAGTGAIIYESLVHVLWRRVMVKTFNSNHHHQRQLLLRQPFQKILTMY